MTGELTIERVLTLVELVPRGRIVSYGDLARIVGIGPREVGSIMRHYGSGMPWWRVTDAAGRLPGSLLARAITHWTDEGILTTRGGRGTDMTNYRADLNALEAAYRTQIATTLARMGTPIPHTSKPAARALTTTGVTTLEELSEWRRADIAELHGMGPRALSILDAALAESELQWRSS